MKKDKRILFLEVIFRLAVVSVCVLENETWALRLLYAIQFIIVLEVSKQIPSMYDYFEQISSEKSKEDERKVFATHECGHAIVAMMVEVNAERITIKCKGKRAGYVKYEKYDKRYVTKEECLKKIQISYGGKAAEEVMLGIVSSGPMKDLKDASDRALEMINDYHMGEQLIVENKKYKEINSIIARKNAEIADKMCNECYESAKRIITANKELVQELTSLLLEKGELNKEEIEAFKVKHNI